jgi:alkylated DNA nucleotide flippase Atl1
LADDKGLPRVVKITPAMSARWGRGTVVIPAPREVDGVMRRVPKGKVVTINDIRSVLAQKHQASICCPITTGIFAWIAAHAAEETAACGAKRITPYWRTLKAGGQLNPKYPGGTQAQRRLLVSEGHRVVKRGRNYVVADFQKSLSTVSQRPKETLK